MKSLDLQLDQTVDVRGEGGRIVIEPVRHAVDLAELLAGITPENLHGEAEFGPAVEQGVVMATRYVPEAGDIVWLQFDPQAGHEQAGHRPALVLSPAAYNGQASESDAVLPDDDADQGLPL